MSQSLDKEQSTAEDLRQQLAAKEELKSGLVRRSTGKDESSSKEVEGEEETCSGSLGDLSKQLGGMKGEITTIDEKLDRIMGFCGIAPTPAVDEN